MAARRSDDPIIVAARQLVETLAADPSFVTEVAETEIERRIQAGRLIPAERLQVAPGLTLVPVGRVEELEAFLEKVLDLTEPLPDDMKEQGAALLAQPVIEPAAAPTPADDDEGDEVDEAPDESETPPPAPESVETPPSPEPEPDPGPQERGRKLPTEAAACANCETTQLTDEDTDEANLEQTKYSMIRFRKPLCRPCMASE